MFPARRTWVLLRCDDIGPRGLGEFPIDSILQIENGDSDVLFKELKNQIASGHNVIIGNKYGHYSGSPGLGQWRISNLPLTSNINDLEELTFFPQSISLIEILPVIDKLDDIVSYYPNMENRNLFSYQKFNPDDSWISYPGYDLILPQTSFLKSHDCSLRNSRGLCVNVPNPYRYFFPSRNSTVYLKKVTNNPILPKSIHYLGAVTGAHTQYPGLIWTEEMVLDIVMRNDEWRSLYHLYPKLRPWIQSLAVLQNVSGGICIQNADVSGPIPNWYYNYSIVGWMDDGASLRPNILGVSNNANFFTEIKNVMTANASDPGIAIYNYMSYHNSCAMIPDKPSWIRPHELVATIMPKTRTPLIFPDTSDGPETTLEYKPRLF